MKNLKTKLLITFIFVLGNNFSQTKWIFHKSHSGSNSSMMLDYNNVSGPGMGRIEYRTPASKIILKYEMNPVSKQKFPIVILDTTNKTMLFFDTKDSLIGCSRDYREYLREGTIIYNIISGSFFVYQKWRMENKKYVKVELFLPIKEMALSSAKNNTIRNRKDFILDGNNHRINMTYPTLISKLIRNFPAPTFEEIHQGVIPTKVNTQKIKRENKRLLKQEKRDAKKEKQKVAPIQETNSEEENSFPLFNVPNFPPKNPSKAPLFAILFLGLFVFAFGMKKILKPTVI